MTQISGPVPIQVIVVDITRGYPRVASLLPCHVAADRAVLVPVVNDACVSGEGRNISIVLFELPLRLSFQKPRCQVLCHLARFLCGLCVTSQPTLETCHDVLRCVMVQLGCAAVVLNLAL